MLNTGNNVILSFQIRLRDYGNVTQTCMQAFHEEPGCALKLLWNAF